MAYTDNMMKIGETVTVRVKNPLWERREAYAFPMTQFQSYTGEVVPSPKWVGPDQICIATGNVRFPFRVIDLERIQGYSRATAPEPSRTSWTIAGSKAGQTYLVTRQGSLWSCNCVGFGYRRTCTHVNEAKSLISQENPKHAPKSLISKEKKNVKKTKKMLYKKESVAYNDKVSEEGEFSPTYKMKGLKMSNKFRPGSKRHKIVEIMNANADRPMDEVIALIVKETGCEERLARHDYTWMTREGVAKGNVPAKSKAPKAPKAPKAKTKEVSASKLLKEVGLKATKKPLATPDEVAAIKAANLVKLKAVSSTRKAKKKVVRDFTGRTADQTREGEGVSDFDPQLAKEEVEAILRDERLIGQVPKFLRDE